jgi:hypothetical protein
LARRCIGPWPGELTGRRRGISLERMIGELTPFLRGWAGSFGLSQLHELPSLDGWIRRGLRCVVRVQWKTRGQRYRELRRLNVSERSASAAVFSPKGPRRPSFSQTFHGETGGCLIRRTAKVRTRMPGGVGGVALRDVPSISFDASAAVDQPQETNPCPLSGYSGATTRRQTASAIKMTSGSLSLGDSLLVPVSQAVCSGYERGPVTHRSLPRIAGPHANILHIKVDILCSGSGVAPGRGQDPAAIVEILGLGDLATRIILQDMIDPHTDVFVRHPITRQRGTICVIIEDAIT